MKTVLRIYIEAKKYWVALIIAFIALIASTIASFYSPLAIRELTNLAIEGQEGFATESLNIGLKLLFFICIQAIGASLSGYLNHYGALNFLKDMRKKYYGKLQNMSLRYFNKSRTGDLTSRMVADVMGIELLIAHVIPEFILNIITFVGIGILLFTISWQLALVSLVNIPILLIITVWQSRKLYPIWKETGRIRGELSSTVQDNLSGIKEIQIFNRQSFEEGKIEKLSIKHTLCYLKSSFLFEITYPLLAFVNALGRVFVIIFGGYLVSKGQIEIADIIAFTMYLSMFYAPVSGLSGLLENAGDSVTSCQRVYEVLDEIFEINELENPKILSRTKGNIRFENVSFYYNKEIPVVKNISLEIKTGETVAFVGTTGIGKSTIANLVNRFYDPQEGTILIDGTDIKTASLASLRDNISMVLQDTFLFNGTVYDNIAYGWKDATHDDVVKAAKSAHAHEFIIEMENGYDTILGERGVRLSGGQKQRVSVARAILRNSPILILDEATSALDTKTESEIQKALDEISKDRTTIVIAHRLSTIKNADQIVVMAIDKIALGT
ncbi:MAG: ABC transporter ATP-binding protein, partial [Lachnospirales bacterium]